MEQVPFSMRTENRAAQQSQSIHYSLAKAEGNSGWLVSHTTIFWPSFRWLDHSFFTCLSVTLTEVMVQVWPHAMRSGSCSSRLMNAVILLMGSKTLCSKKASLWKDAVTSVSLWSWRRSLAEFGHLTYPPLVTIPFYWKSLLTVNRQYFWLQNDTRQVVWIEQSLDGILPSTFYQLLQ